MKNDFENLLKKYFLNNNTLSINEPIFQEIQNNIIIILKKINLLLNNPNQNNK